MWKVIKKKICKKQNEKKQHKSKSCKVRCLQWIFYSVQVFFRPLTVSASRCKLPAINQVSSFASFPLFPGSAPDSPPYSLLTHWALAGSHSPPSSRESERVTVLVKSKLSVSSWRLGSVDPQSFEELHSFLWPHGNLSWGWGGRRWGGEGVRRV